MTGSTILRWEYLTVPEGERHRLSALGEEGWELAGVGGNSDEPLLYLKRPGLDYRERVTVEQRNRYYTFRGLDPLRTKEPERG